MDVRNKVVINQQGQHIRYPPQQMSPSGMSPSGMSPSGMSPSAMPPQQLQQQQPPMSSNWNRMPTTMQQQQPQHGNLIQQQQKAPMPMQNAYQQQQFNQPPPLAQQQQQQQHQYMSSQHTGQQMIYGGQPSHLQNALQHPMKANADPNMSTAAISNQPISNQPMGSQAIGAPNTSTSELIKQVQESDPLTDELTDEVMGNEDDLIDFDGDFNILEYADPDIDKTQNGQKGSILDENLDELFVDKDEELDKEKPKDALENQPASGSSHPPPPYSAAIQQSGQRKNTDGDLMNLFTDSDFEKMKSDLFDNQMSSPIGKFSCCFLFF